MKFARKKSIRDNIQDDKIMGYRDQIRDINQLGYIS